MINRPPEGGEPAPALRTPSRENTGKHKTRATNHRSLKKRTAQGTEQPGKRNFTYRRAPTNALRPPPSLPRTLRSRAVCFRLLEHTGRLPTQNAPCRYGPHLPETVPSPSARNHAAALSGRLYLRRDRQTAQGDLLPFYRNDTSPFHDGPPSQRHDKNGGSPGTPQRPPPFLLHILQVLL